MPLRISLASIFAAITLALVLGRALLTVDPYWDTLAYHWPYSARAAGLCDMHCFQMPKAMEDRYDGFPVLFNWAQGQLWRLTGSPGFGDLVGIGMLLGLCAYLRWRFCVPLAWSWLGFIAVPLVQAHATSSYVDLPANVALAIGLLVGVRISLEREADPRVDLAIALAALGMAAGGKLQLVPVAILIWTAIIVTVSTDPSNSGLGSSRKRALLMYFAGCAVLLPAAVWNLVRFGNPFYPIAIELGPIHFDGPERMMQVASLSTAWQGVPSPIRWLASVLEIDAYGGRPTPWTIDQGDVSSQARSFRMGGYFVGYVLALASLLMWAWLESPPSRKATAFVIAASITCALLPLSHELRYYMFWMLSLISIVLVIAFSPKLAASRPKLFRPAVCAAISISLATVIAVTGGKYFSIHGPSISELVEPTRPTVDALPAHATLCLLNRDRRAILYSRLFHEGTEHRVMQADDDGLAGCTIKIAPD